MRFDSVKIQALIEAFSIRQDLTGFKNLSGLDPSLRRAQKIRFFPQFVVVSRAL